MTSEITPPPELVQQWWTEFERTEPDTDSLVFIATQAARWGSDQELLACCEWLADPEEGTALRKHRRPKPPSLKEQALQAHGPEPLPEPSPHGDAILNAGAIERHRLVRRALEQLDD